MSKKLKITIYSLLGVTVALIIAAAIILIVGARNEGAGDFDDSRNQMSDKDLAAEILRLENEKTALQERISELEAGLEDAGEYYKDEIEQLKLAISEKNEEIASLEADIERYQTVFNTDVRAQAKLIDEIVEYIENESPYLLVAFSPMHEADTSASPESTTDTTESGNAEPAEVEYKWMLVTDLMAEELEKAGDTPLFSAEELEMSGLTEKELTDKILRRRVLAREDVTYPSVSIYYEDIRTGYHFGYEADKIYDAASVVKAPYILSVLQTIAADEEAYFERLIADNREWEMIDTDEDGVPDKRVIEYSNPLYDLSETVIYDKASMYKSGSGEIKNMADGTEFTYLDFVKYTLKYSDNIAYQQLRSRFGYDTMRALATSLGAKSIFKGGNSMSAADAGKFFGAIYEFCSEDEKYGAVMHDAMLNSGHTVIIPNSVYPIKCLHKYGWDSGVYHDAGIVLYKDKPYLLSVFTDLDMGGAEVNSYLQGIVKMVNKLHKGLYGQ